jgi:GNAT superfamily N-acetyltransferase
MASPRFQLLTHDGPLDIARQKQCAAHWSHGFTVDKWLACEQLLRQRSSFQQPGAYTPCALVQGDDVVASCEIYRMTGVVRTASGALQEGALYGIASVFTPDAHRRKGYAALLLRSVRQHLEQVHTDGALPCLGTLLMCEAAQGLYESVGYVATPRSCPPMDWEFYATEPGFEMHTRCKLLTEADVPTIAAELGDRVRAALTDAEPGSIAVVPSASQLEWHRMREEARRKTTNAPPAPESCGAVCGRSIILWAIDDADHMAAADGDEQSRRTVLRVLIFLPCDAGRTEDDAAVLAAAVQVAQQADCTVVMWDTDGLARQPSSAKWAPPEEELALMGVVARFVDRDCGSIPMLHAQFGGSAQRWSFIPRAVWM